MRSVLVAVLVAHGLLHGLGFVKAFGLAELPQLTQAISRPLGVAWLIAGLAMLVTAATCASHVRTWWAVALGAVALSQLVIVTSWTDARFGTLANAVVLAAAIVAALGSAPWSYRTRFEREALARRDVGVPAAPVTEDDLARLPAPVARYLRVSGVVGRPRTTRFRARFRGRIRSREGAPWMPFTADQESFFEPPARLFFMAATRAGVPCDVLHVYRDGVATMAVRVASLVRVVDGRGPLLDRSETVTFLNDACLLAPGALVSPAFRWEPIDERRARVRLAIGGHDVSAELVFDDGGRLVDFVSDDRARSDDGRTGERLRWTTPVSQPRTFDGRTIAAHGEAIWHAPEGAYVYGVFELEDLTFDV